MRPAALQLVADRRPGLLQRLGVQHGPALRSGGGDGALDDGGLQPVDGGVDGRPRSSALSDSIDSGSSMGRTPRTYCTK